MSWLMSMLRPCRLVWIALVLFVVLVPTVAPTPGATQAQPDPRPDDDVSFYDDANLFPEDQLQTLRRDAELLQSTEIPTLVYVRSVSAAEAARGESRAFADRIREAWDVASAPGADDGLVLLMSWVPENPLATSTVMSYGEHTFDGSGLTPEAIEEAIATSVLSLVEQERPFEALIYLMRKTRYSGIYAPPPPAPLDGARETVHDTLRWLGPIALIATVAVLAMVTAASWQLRPTPGRVRRIIGATLALVVLLWSISVYGESRVGIASALVILAALAVAAWVWSRVRFIRHGSPPVRRRAVPATRSLMRKRRQARTLLARATGEQR